MNPIKFRGRDVHTGEYVFGFYTTGSDDKSFIIINSAQGQYLREVKFDSVAQLVGFDKDGKEVYEGDTLIDSEGYEYLVSLQGMVLLQPLKKDGYVAHLPADLRTMLLDVAKRFTPLTLKED